MGKTILVLVDGLKYETAVTCLTYLNGLVSTSRAARRMVRAELPTMSRPLYEVLLTGTVCAVHGIATNDTVRLSSQTSVFHLAAEHGLVTAAAAYHWVSELYNRAPFVPREDREQHCAARPIQHGKFYFADAYPDSHLFLDGEVLRRDRAPDFLLVHPMGADDAGHRHGGEAAEYRERVREMDAILAELLPLWTADHYQVVITADHGMRADGGHGGDTPAERDVPLYGIGPFFLPGAREEALPQTSIAPILCGLLGIPPAPAMRRIDAPGLLSG